MNTKTLTNEVVVAMDAIVKVGRADVEALKKGATVNERRRMRLCAHKETDEKLQEMFIVLSRDVYIRPHKHVRKAESLHILEGRVDVVFFSDAGDITDVVPMGDYASGGLFYYRMDTPVYHTLILQTEFLAFHESTTGPFDRAETIFAPWSPDEKDASAVAAFRADLARRASSPRHPRGKVPPR